MMKKFGYTMMAVGIFGTGLIAYNMLSSDTRRKVKRTINSALDDVQKTVKKTN